MTKPILYLFPDTNLFIQCRPLDQLNWSELGDFAEIHLIVCRPVQREIDNQKNRGNDRVAKRARKTYPLFRKIIIGETGYELVNDDPPVKIFIQSSSLPDEDLSSTLDYGKSDDEIVGCCSRYARENSGLDIRLLTHDTGPMMSAQSVGLRFIPINDDWLIPPEHNQLEREIARLESEVTRLKRAEPQFSIAGLNEQGEEVSLINFVHEIYEPLNDTEISDLLEMLKDRFPLTTNFNPYTPKPESMAAGLASAMWGEWEYVPAAADEIDNYQSQMYPEWLNECELILSKVHEKLQRLVRPPSFCFSAVNEGTRPGSESLVEITAKGNFEICPTQFTDNATEASEEEVLSFPRPPKAPTGGWKASRHPAMSETVTSLLSNILAGQRNELFFPTEDSGPLFEIPVYHGPSTKPQRDPNRFYYKSDSPEIPAKSFSLECKQWLHAAEPEEFQGIISFEDDGTEIRGLVECVIRASNLSVPVTKRVPVRIEIKPVSSRSYAERLIEDIDPMSIFDN